MSLLLSRQQIFQKLQPRKFFWSSDKLLTQLKQTKQRFEKVVHYSRVDYPHHECNPLLWQHGHVSAFYSKHVLDNLCTHQDEYTSDYETILNYYDSHKTTLEQRQEPLLTYEETKRYYHHVTRRIESLLRQYELSPQSSYLIMLGILHNEMHTESFLFTHFFHHKDIPYTIDYNDNLELQDEIEFVSYTGGNFYQGSVDSQRYLIFDNEMPSFATFVKPFQISKYPVTESQYLQFVMDGGYSKKDYWCENGWRWKEREKLNHPKYWSETKYSYEKRINQTKQNVNTDLPMIHISHYEASAFCRWYGGRLPTETEFEYVATNGGKTVYPWGNDSTFDNCNINYKRYLSPVNHYSGGENQKGVSQLIGNVWEWCEEEIYPYDGFTIDPVYREMSYPYFGFKKICKGGSFAVPDCLIHPRYRNAQYPDCYQQFIGFRVCNDI